MSFYFYCYYLTLNFTHTLINTLSFTVTHQRDGNAVSEECPKGMEEFRAAENVDTRLHKSYNHHEVIIMMLVMILSVI